MKIDPETRFSDTVQNYDRYRPSYSKALIDWIVTTAAVKPPDRIADIGCGTGLATRLFAKRGFSVIGIDPNEAMLADARRHRSSAIYQKGDAQNTGLESGSVDAVISAQAFHWFDFDQTMPELKRILKPSGSCFAFWNVRKRTPLSEAYEALLRIYSGDYERTPKGAETIEAIKKHPMVRLPKESQFDNDQIVDLEGLIGRAYSSSYVVHGVKNHHKFKEELEALFNKHQSQGNVTFNYDTLAVCWRL